MPTLRPFAPDDLYPLVDCWFDTWHAAFQPRRHPRPIHLWRRRFRDEYLDQAEVWLAPANDRVAAFLVLFPDARWLEQLFVHPDFQSQGLGSALVALAQFRCPQGLELDTAAENSPAREFYRRRGFQAQQAGFDPVTERLTLRYAWHGTGLSAAAGPVSDRQYEHQSGCAHRGTKQH